MINKSKSFFKSSYNSGVRYYNNWDGNDFVKLLFAAVIIVLFIGFIGAALYFAIMWPILLAWSINYLFGTTIPLTFTTWIAIVVLFWASRFFLQSKSFITITRK